MDNFVVSARKYRPASFDTVVGQLSITSTLRNAIVGQQLAQAYLFCGPRGVGKTTCARIFAKTINCMNLKENAEACNECESCQAFDSGRSLNIHELDAASNNSVDDIRGLVEQVRILPQIGRYSVYIIDEVHMLSTSAFNAFLKTLEEPPAHAVFILATTEKHKILPTILSRCQIYDFNRMKVGDTVAHLKYIADKEGVTAEDEALDVIAQKADGAMRDALSIFDQIVSFCGKHLTYNKIIENLNVLDYDYYFRLTSLFYDGNVSDSLLLLNEILEKGFDAAHLVAGLGKHFRDVLVAKDKATVQLLEVSAGIRERYMKQATECSVDFLYDALKIAEQCEMQYKQRVEKRLCVELAFIRLCQINELKKKSLIQSDQILLKIEGFNGKFQVASSDPKVTLADHSAQVVNLVKPKEEKAKPATSFRIKDAFSETSPSIVSMPEMHEEEKKIQCTGNDPFDLSQLEAALSEYVAKNTPEKIISIALKARKPDISGHNITIKVDNLLQKDKLEACKAALQNFLIESLNNGQINCLIELYERQAGEIAEKNLITAQSKLDYFIELNPVIDEMRRMFGLEIG